jgi:photosystem II stability/assembly factor-like uncharacterized protein
MNAVRMISGLRGQRGAGRAVAWAALLAGAAVVAGCESKGVAPVPAMPPLDSVRVSPKTDTLLVDQTLTLTAAAYDTLGALVSNPSFTWTSRAPQVVSVSTRGVVRGVSEGSGYVVATAGGQADSALIAVYPGNGWIPQASATSNVLNGVFFLPDGRTGWAVGNAGTIRVTTDAGETWTQQVSNTGYNLQSVFFASLSRGWACGGNGTVLLTDDGGAHWSLVTAPSGGQTLNDLYFADADTGWAVGNVGVILRTRDGGATWTRLLPAVTSENLKSVSFSGLDDGWAVGDNGVIMGTHDGGLSWYIYQPAVTTAALDAVWRRSTSLAWAVGPTAGTMLRTTAGPDSALWQTSGLPNYRFYGVCFPGDQLGYAVGYSTQAGAGAVLRSDDGGQTWSTQASNTGRQLNDVFFVDALHGWAVGEAGAIIHTARGGLP